MRGITVNTFCVAVCALAGLFASSAMKAGDAAPQAKVTVRKGQEAEDHLRAMRVQAKIPDGRPSREAPFPSSALPSGGGPLKLAQPGSKARTGDAPCVPGKRMRHVEPGRVPVTVVREELLAGNYAVGIFSHYAGFVTNYPHDDGPSYHVYDSTNEKMPVWGMASGGPSPGVANAVWVGGDFDAEISTVACGYSASCLIPPPVDGVYRGWRTQGYSTGPCHCPTAIQKAYFSSNRGIAMFDLSYIPDKATLQSVSFQGKIAKQFGSGERLNISQIDADRSVGLENVSGTGFKWAYDDASDGHLYVTSWNVAPYAIGNPASVGLGSTSLSDVALALARNWYGLGLVSGAGETSTTAYYFGAFEGSGGSAPPLLTVNYHYVVPGAPTRLGGSYEAHSPEAGCSPNLEWNIPAESDGHPLHFEVLLSDTGPAYLQERFTNTSGIDFGQTSYAGMVDTATHDIYDDTGAYTETWQPSIHLDPLDLTDGSGNVYPYGNGYNVGWRFGRSFVSHLASDTYTSGGYLVDGLGDAMIGKTYMEWSSDSAISYPDTACATNIGYSANITTVGGYLPSGLTESFEVAFAYSDDPSNYYSIATVSDAASTFEVDFDPPEPNVVSVALFFQSSTDGYAYLSDLQIFDSKVYDVTEAQVVTSSVMASTSSPSVPIAHATLTADEDVPSGTSIAYEMSNDSGNSWYSVSSGSDFAFPTQGNQLRWRATLATSDGRFTPRLYGVDITNLVGGAPVNSQTTSVFKENATLQGTFQSIPSAGAPCNAGGRSWQARYTAQGLAAGNYAWCVRAFAPAGSTDRGALSPTWTFKVDPSDTTPPPVMGNVLRMTPASGGAIHLQWAAYNSDPLAHAHVYRATRADFVGATKTEVYGPYFTDPSPPSGLVYYKVLPADDCENEAGQ